MRVVKTLSSIGIGRIIVVLIAVFLLCTCILSVLKGIAYAPAPPFHSCDRYLSGANAVRVVANYGNSRLKVGSSYDFSHSDDSGKTWQEALSFPLDEPHAELECSNLEGLGEHMAWIWIRPGRFFVTHDAGETWTTWSPSESWLAIGHNCHGRWDIKRVVFTNESDGQMQFDTSWTSCLPKVLYSADGGLTWQEGSP